MDEKMKFDYYYGIEAEQFSFYRVPRLLIKDQRFKNLSSDAKLLYGLMLDRMALSMKNGWLDEENRAYIIYAVENVMEDLGCSKPTCIKIIKELDVENGIGLIERKRRGLGKPDIIYVKNFAVLQAGDEPEKKPEESEQESAETENEEKKDVLTEENAFTSGSKESLPPEVKNLYFSREKNFTSASKESLPPEVKNLYFKKEKNFTSASKETELQEVKKFAPNYNNTSYNNQSYTEESNTNPIYPSENIQEDTIDEMDDVNAYMELIKKNIEYEHHMKFDKHEDRELYDELFQIICEIVCVKHKTVRIGGEEYPYELVKAKFLKLTASHLEYVMLCMKNTTTKIGNIKAYMVTTLEVVY